MLQAGLNYFLGVFDYFLSSVRKKGDLVVILNESDGIVPIKYH